MLYVLCEYCVYCRQAEGFGGVAYDGYYGECYVAGTWLILVLIPCFVSVFRCALKIFRRIYGPKYENGEWKSRTNRELEEMGKEENVVKWIKGQRVSWLSHLERMEENRMPKKIFTEELEGSRRRGRPRKGWREEIERDIQVLGVRRWIELVTDRTKWRDTVRQAKAHSGL
jgi:hypothetical protein